MTTLLTYTRLVSRAVLSFVSHLEHGARKAVWKVSLVCGSLSARVDTDLSVNLSGYVSDAGSILLSTVQTELIENQLSMKLLKSVHAESITGGIHLVTTVFPVIEDHSSQDVCVSED